MGAGRFDGRGQAPERAVASGSSTSHGWPPELCMLLVYPKSARDTIPGHILRMIRKELEDGIEQEG